MKRLNNYLLTHHPLLWNLRLHWVWPAIIVLHLLFFTAGYAPVSFPGSLSNYALRVREGVMSMSILTALLLGVLWLVFYFRNNAFKSHYPLAKGRLAAELGLVFATCIGLTTFTASFEGGRYSHVRAISRDIDLRHEADITNLAHHFLPFEKSEFSQRSDCGWLRDTTTVATSTQADTFSYLHYCGSDMPQYSYTLMRSPQGNDSIAKRWLLGGKQDSVRLLLREYLGMVKKYGGSYRFDADAQVREIFSEPGFPVKRELKRNAYDISGMSVYNNDGDADAVPTAVYVPGADSAAVHDPRYIEDQRINSALTAVEDARDGWLDNGTALFLLYFSLGIALLIFSYRITAVRTWFIALIGVGIWMAIFGVLGGVFHGGEGMILVYLALALVFLFTAISLIAKRREKMRAGGLYLWAFWAMPAFLPLIISYIDDKLRPYNSIYNPRTKTYSSPPAPVHDWISTHWTLIGFMNMALFLLLLLALFIPLARRWQAMSEE